MRDGVRNHATNADTRQGDATVAVEIKDDVAVVPLAIPTIIGPATIGAILVAGAELKGQELFYGIVGMLLALSALLILLRLSAKIEKILGSTGLNILSKITGLILAAMAAQLIFTGIKSSLQL